MRKKTLMTLFPYVDFENDYDMKLRVCHCDKSHSPFRFLNSDHYSALDIDPSIAGSSAVEYFLSENDNHYWKVEEVYVYSLVELVLNRSLSKREQRIVSTVIDLYNYACHEEDEDKEEIIAIIKSIRAANSWDTQYLIPVQFVLFLLFGENKEITSKINEIRQCGYLFVLPKE